MTLFQYTLGQLLRGEKTETSRLALPLADGEHIVGREMIQYPMGNKAVMRGTPHGWRLKWQVGREYSIQPKRGEKSIGKYRVVDIWRQDVRTLTDEQIKAEGFDLSREFYYVWTGMHDKQSQHATLGILKGGSLLPQVYLAFRPDEHYQAWRMKIEVLWETVLWDAPAIAALHIPQKAVE